jgi:uncharacterized BrkB/YihY/UPF0761 family membrane protein
MLSSINNYWHNIERIYNNSRQRGIKMTKTKKIISLLLTLLFSLFLISCGKSSQVNNTNNTAATS